MWYNNIHAAIQSLYPTALRVHDWLWVSHPDGPRMDYWNTDKLGKLNLAAIEAEALRLASIIPVPKTITRRQCARELYTLKMISGPEMVAMTATGTPPAVIETVFSKMPEASQWVARADFAADTYERSNPLLVGIMTASGASSTDIDNFFREASVK